MKIVSPWHDYYDGGMRHAAGEGALFLRKTEEFPDSASPLCKQYAFLQEFLPREVEIRLAEGGWIEMTPFRLAFCGIVFNGVRFHVVPMHGADTMRHVYTRGDLINAVSDYKLAKPHHQANLLEANHKVWGRKLDAFLDAPADTARSAEFSIHGHALVAGWAERMVLNPSLKALEFYRVRDAIQAYQALEMFFDGRAAPENQPPVVIEDKHRIAQHGFDAHSFRKAPTKRR